MDCMFFPHRLDVSRQIPTPKRDPAYVAHWAFGAWTRETLSDNVSNVRQRYQKRRRRSSVYACASSFR